MAFSARPVQPHPSAKAIADPALARPSSSPVPRPSGNARRTAAVSLPTTGSGRETPSATQRCRALHPPPTDHAGITQAVDLTASMRRPRCAVIILVRLRRRRPRKPPRPRPSAATRRLTSAPTRQTGNGQPAQRCTAPTNGRCAPSDRFSPRSDAHQVCHMKLLNARVKAHATDFTYRRGEGRHRRRFEAVIERSHQPV